MKNKLIVTPDAVRADGIWIYRLSGNLFGSSDAYAFQNEVRQKLTDGVPGIILDLGAIERIDSSGIGILVAMMWSASQGRGQMILAALPARVENVLKIAMLLDHIDHAATVAEALDKITSA